MYCVEVKNYRYKVRYYTDCKFCHDMMIKYKLTLKQAQFYKLIKDGKSYSDIKNITGLADATIRYQLSMIRAKTKEVTPKRKVVKQARVVMPVVIKPVVVKPVASVIELPVGGVTR